MASNPRSRWRPIGLLVAFGLTTVAVLPGCAGSAPPAEREAHEPGAAASPADGRGVRVHAGSGGSKATRRIAEDCDPVGEALRYNDFVGNRAMAVLGWTGMAQQAADLKIPVYVVAVEEGAVAVRFLQFPMREQYLHIWLGSGHIQPGPENLFMLQPCSATLEPWPYPASDETTG